MASTGEFIIAMVILVAITVPFIVVFGAFCLLVGFFLWGMKKKTENQMKVMYEEMQEEAYVNKPDNMIRLVRYPAPFFGDLIVKMQDMIADGNNTELLDEVSKLTIEIKQQISTLSGVEMGSIVGFNRFDLLTTLEGMQMPQSTEDYPLSKMDVKDKEAMKELIKTCGRYLNFIVYEKKTGWFIFGKKIKQGIFAFDNQVVGLDSSDGTVMLLGQGTARIGIYFQILSGYPEKIGVLLTHLIETSRIRWAMLLEGNLIELTEKSANFDTQFMKLAELKSVSGDSSNKVNSEK